MSKPQQTPVPWIALALILFLVAVPSGVYYGAYLYNTVDVFYHELAPNDDILTYEKDPFRIKPRSGTRWVEIRQFKTRWQANIFLPASRIKGAVQGREVLNNPE